MGRLYTKTLRPFKGCLLCWLDGKPSRGSGLRRDQGTFDDDFGCRVVGTVGVEAWRPGAQEGADAAPQVTVDGDLYQRDSHGGSTIGRIYLKMHLPVDRAYA